MRIVSVRVEPVARIFAILYAICGLGSFLIFAFSDVQYLTLPFGVLAPLFHLNVNLNLQRAASIPYSLLLCLGSVLSYSLTGWLTGTATALCFNFAARRMGGIDAKYFTVTQTPVSATESTF